MVFARILRNLIRDPELGPRIVPIIPDEARTFGMDPLFKEVGIYSALGQRYEPVDSDLVLSYREATDGQVLEEGITEAGSMASFQAAGTSYATHGLAMIPFYIFYSMFGFQRTGDQIWAFGDARGRGFLMGATAGRTTLNGEGLQHDDGHSQILASTVPNLRAYDPAFAYELAAVVRDGIERMYGPKPEDVFYYVTLYNENYVQPPRPDVTDEAILRGLYRFAAAPDLGRDAHPARLVGSGCHPPAGARGAGPAGREVRRGGRGLQRAVVPAAPPRRARGRTLEPPPSRCQEAARPARQHDPAVRGRTDRRRHRLDEGPARHGVAAGCRRTTWRSGRTASAGAIRARRFGACSRSIRRTSLRRRSSGSPDAGHFPRRRRPRRSPSSASTRTRPTRSPCDGSASRHASDTSPRTCCGAAVGRRSVRCSPSTSFDVIGPVPPPRVPTTRRPQWIETTRSTTRSERTSRTTTRSTTGPRRTRRPTDTAPENEESGNEALGAGAGVLGGAAVGMAVGGPPGAVIGGAIGGVAGAVAGEATEGDDEAGSGTGALGGGAAGAVIGGAVAGPPGAVVGAAVGAGAGAGAGDQTEEEVEESTPDRTPR